MKTTDFKEFMSHVDWNELDINDKQALVEAIRCTSNMQYGEFEVTLLDGLQDKTIVKALLHDVEIVLDIPLRVNFIRYLENTYMYGEDCDAYLSWLAEIGGKKIFNPFVKETVIRPLPIREQRVVKMISIGKKVRTRLHIANIVYTRTLSNQYNTKEGNTDVIMDAGGNRFPHDELDRCIENAIQKDYKDALLHTEYQIYDNEKIRNNKLLDNLHQTQIHGDIICTANMEPLNVEYPQNCFSFNLNLYADRKDSIKFFENMRLEIIVSDLNKYTLLRNLVNNTLLMF